MVVSSMVEQSDSRSSSSWLTYIYWPKPQEAARLARTTMEKIKYMRGMWLLFLTVATTLSAQQKISSLNDSIRTYIGQHRSAILQEFEEFLALPNIASDEANIQKNADALAQMLQKRGLQARLLKVEHASPVVLAELLADPTKRTVTFYAHYDGQPVDKTQWKHDPWKPTLVGKDP